MKFGVRDICDVVFKAKDDMEIGSAKFIAGQPVLYIDSATASTVEQGSTTNYATGGTGNQRLVAWEGEKTLTFTVTDALLSPVSLSILSGAGLFKGESKGDSTQKVHIHMTATSTVRLNSNTITIDLTSALESGETICKTAPIFVSVLDKYNDLTGGMLKGLNVSTDGKSITGTSSSDTSTIGTVTDGMKVLVDFYITKSADKVSEIQIDASSFGGNFYVEASTLFREQTTGTDCAVEMTLPNVKVQSNFSFSLSASGDPSTFDFVMDAMPGYTYFDNTKKVAMVMQIVEDTKAGTDSSPASVMLHNTDESQINLGRDAEKVDSVE